MSAVASHHKEDVATCQGDGAGEQSRVESRAREQDASRGDTGQALFTFGYNFRGQVDPHSDAVFQMSPILLSVGKAGEKLIEIKAGGSFSLALGANGSVWSWGLEFLGTGQSERNFMQVQFPVGASRCKIISLSAGQSHAAAVGEDGQVFTWGLGLCGRLGHGSEHAVAMPRRVEYLWKAGLGENKNGDNFEKGLVLQVACGQAHTLALTSKGSIYAWGLNSNYQCTRGLSDGNGSNLLEPRRIACSNIRDQDFVTAVFCGNQHSMLLTNEGSVFSWGLATFGRLGHSPVGRGPNNPKVISYPRLVEMFSGANAESAVWKLSLGSAHAIALTCSGAVYVWGRNDKGQLGIGRNLLYVSCPTLMGSPDLIVSDVQAGANHSLLAARLRSAPHNDEQIFMWGIGFGGGGTSPSVAFDDEDVWSLPTQVNLPAKGWCASASLGGAHTMVLLEISSDCNN